MSDTLGSPNPLDVLKQFRSIFRAIKQHFQKTESMSQVSGTQIWGLSIVARQPGIRVSDLADTMGIHQSTCSNLIDILCRQKMLVKQRSEDDQRVVHLFPSEAGAQALEKVPPPLEGILPNALQQLSKKDITELHALLKKLIQVLQKHDPYVVMEADMPLAEIVGTPTPLNPIRHFESIKHSRLKKPAA